MSKLIKMVAFNNRGPYNTGESFACPPSEVKKHALYARPLLPTPPKAVAEKPKSQSKVEGTQASDSKGQQEEKPVAADSPDQTKTEGTQEPTPKQSKRKVTKPASSKTKGQ